MLIENCKMVNLKNKAPLDSQTVKLRSKIEIEEHF